MAIGLRPPGNRIVEQVTRTGCGYHNMPDDERRILTHIALTRAA